MDVPNTSGVDVPKILLVERWGQDDNRCSTTGVAFLPSGYGKNSPRIRIPDPGGKKAPHPGSGTLYPRI
jgi:hypothetical protein